MKTITFSIFIFANIISIAQNVGINSNGALPNASAILDVDAAPGNNKGLLIPRIALSSLISNAPIGAGIAVSLLVYNTATSGVAPNQVSPGFYYWNGTKWERLETDGNAWDLDGNTGTSAANNFVGTVDNVDLRFRINNTHAGLLNNANASTFFGYKAGVLTTGAGNTCLGFESGKSNTTGTNNCFIGRNAGELNQDGDNNIAIGYFALSSNLTGTSNSAIGLYSLKNNTANYNVAIGHRSMFANTTGEFNVAMGYNALDNNLIGDNNVALGRDACNVVKGSDNIGIGQNAVSLSTTADFNIGIGRESLENSTGANNVGLGVYSLNGNTTGTNNTAVGYNAFLTGSTYSNSSAFGANTAITASNQVRIGNNAVSSIGGFANWTNVSDERFKSNIKSNVPGLEFILKLQPVTYNLDISKINSFLKIENSGEQQAKTTELQTGFIAQDVEQAAKSLGFEFSGVDKPDNEGDYYGLRYAEFVVPLVKAMQEQQVLIEKSNQKIAELEQAIRELKNK